MTTKLEKTNMDEIMKIVTTCNVKFLDTITIKYVWSTNNGWFNSYNDPDEIGYTIIGKNRKYESLDQAAILNAPQTTTHYSTGREQMVEQKYGSERVYIEDREYYDRSIVTKEVTLIPVSYYKIEQK